jgi:alpha-N-acetylglucosamine transferase
MIRVTALCVGVALTLLMQYKMATHYLPDSSSNSADSIGTLRVGLSKEKFEIINDNITFEISDFRLMTATDLNEPIGQLETKETPVESSNFSGNLGNEPVYATTKNIEADIAESSIDTVRDGLSKEKVLLAHDITFEQSDVRLLNETDLHASDEVLEANETSMHSDISADIRNVAANATTINFESNRDKVESGDESSLALVKNLTTTRFAYAYLVGGCDPNEPVYRNFLYNILVNTRQMRRDGSQSDVIVMIQMLYKIRNEMLPPSDLRLLDALNIQVVYIPARSDESFETLLLEKFHVLQWTQYERIVVMDGDIMLRGSLDYFMELSVQGILQSNIVFAGRYVPAVGGLFIIQPGKYNLFSKILNRTNTSTEGWDVVQGWGHPFNNGDTYTLVNGKKGYAWDFPGASMDQGLLYHWTKYEQQSISIVYKNSIENWGTTSNGQIHVEETLKLDAINGHSTEHKCWELFMGHKPCVAPHRDFLNFPGAMKPWLHRPPSNFISHPEESPSHFWYYELSMLNEQLQIGLNFEQWQLLQRPLFGYQTSNSDVVPVSINAVPHTSDTMITPTDPRSGARPVGVIAPETKDRLGVFAYAYVIGGCDPNEPGAYRNFIHNVLINTYLQRKESSQKSDVVVFIQMSYESGYDELPEADISVLNAMKINIMYIPKNEHESFERLMFDKFRIVTLTKYKRVLFMDADILIRGNLDYLFELSLKGIIKENLVIAGRREPAIGALFMITPKDGDWDQLLNIIRDKEARGLNLPPPYFDEETGWGHKFQSNETYELINGIKKSRWDFGGASSDQGLLYSWVRFEKKSVSIVTKDKVKNWGTGPDGKVVLEETLDIDVFTNSGLPKQRGRIRECWVENLGHKPCVPPHSDYIHFPGYTKPWMKNGPPYDLFTATPMKSPTHFWFLTLSVLNNELNLGLDFNHWEKNLHPPLGVRPKSIHGKAITYAESATKTFSSPYTKYMVNATRSHRFAYAYVIGGVLPEDPAYRSYFSDIVISTYLQREGGSQADVVVFVQMAYDSSFDTLPSTDLNLLNAAGIIVKYIPKVEHESFYRLMMDKFRILSLTEYDRVLYMDGDVMVRRNLDYLFDLSVTGVLKKNIIFAGHAEPANGGLFMLAPTKESQKQILNVIRNKETRCATLPYPHWDEDVGWGHVIDGTDYYEFLRGSKQQKYNFYGAFADQGLLYHWVKYEEKSVSIVMRENIQNWDVGDDGKVMLESIIDLQTLNMKRSTMYQHQQQEPRICWAEVMNHKPCIAPHSDFVHFTGKRKPWLQGPPPLDEIKDNNGATSAWHFWFYTLWVLNDKMQMGLDFNNWRAHHRPSLGMFPKQNDAALTKYASNNSTFEN